VIIKHYKYDLECSIINHRVSKYKHNIEHQICFCVITVHRVTLEMINQYKLLLKHT